MNSIAPESGATASAEPTRWDGRPKTNLDGWVIDNEELFEELKAKPSFDIWGYGVVLFELLTGQKLWHEDRDCNIAKREDYTILAEWTDEQKAAALSRVPDLLGRALLWKLLSKNPKLRPQSMAEVLRHPFFDEEYNEAAIANGEEKKSEKKTPQKLFFCETAGTHVQLAVEKAADGAVEARSNRLADAEALVAKGDPGEKAQIALADCDAFVLVLTPGIFQNATAVAAINAALDKPDMPLVVVCEAEAKAPPLCSRCKSWPAALAIHGMKGESLTRCEAHIKPGLWGVDATDTGSATKFRDAPLYNDAGKIDLDVAFARAAAPPVVATVEPKPAAGGAAAPSAPPSAEAVKKAEEAKAKAAAAASSLVAAAALARNLAKEFKDRSGRVTAVPWSVDVDFEQTAAALVLSAVHGLSSPPVTEMFSGLACRSPLAPPLEVEQAAVSATVVPAAGAGGGSEQPAAPAPPTPCNVRILFDGAKPAAREACERIQSALCAEFRELLSVVLIDASVGGKAAEEAAKEAGRGAKSVLLFLTVGLLKRPVASAFLTAALRGREAPAHVVVAHHACAARGGAPVFEDFMRDVPAELKKQDGLDLRPFLHPARSIAWQQHPAFAPVFALKLVNAGLVDPPLSNGEYAACAEHAVSLHFLLNVFKVELEKERQDKASRLSGAVTRVFPTAK